MEFLRSIGFIVMLYDDCVLVNRELSLYIVIYVDDLQIYAFSLDVLQGFLAKLRARFETTEPRFLHEATSDDPPPDDATPYELRRDWLLVTLERPAFQVLGLIYILLVVGVGAW